MSDEKELQAANGINNPTSYTPDLSDITRLSKSITDYDVLSLFHDGASSAAVRTLTDTAINTTISKMQPFDDSSVHPLPEYRELPDVYGDTKIVLLVRDPEWVFAYWEINEYSKLEHGMIGENSAAFQLVVRVYQITGRNWPFDRANYFYDIPVHQAARSVYISIPEAGKTWITELGIVKSDGVFQPIARSLPADAPRNTISREGEIEWMTVLENQIGDPNLKTFTKERRDDPHATRSLLQDGLMGRGMGAGSEENFLLWNIESSPSSPIHGSVGSSETFYPDKK